MSSVPTMGVGRHSLETSQESNVHKAPVSILARGEEQLQIVAEEQEYIQGVIETESIEYHGRRANSNFCNINDIWSYGKRHAVNGSQ